MIDLDNQHIALTVLQVAIFFGSWLIPDWFAGWWTRQHHHPRPRPDPNDYRLDAKARADRERELAAIDQADWSAHHGSGHTFGFVLMLVVMALDFWLLPRLFQ